MDQAVEDRRIARFGPYCADLRSGELRKNGSRVRLQEQPLRLLAILLERAGDVVTRDELRERLWGGDTFVDFDHGLNTAIQKLRTALNDSAEAPRFIETLPRHGYRFIAAVEWTADAVTQTTAAIRKSNRARWTPVAAVIAAVFLLLAVSAVVYLRRRPERPVAVQSICILPFANAEQETEYVSDGLAEDLVDELSSLPELRVASRTSSFRFKGKTADPRAIARQLNVAAVLTGKVARTADQYQVDLELIDSKDGAALWAKSYSTRATELQMLKRHIAVDLSLRLGLTRTDDPRLRQEPSPAYDLYLRGRYLWNYRSTDSILRAVATFEQAVKVDPNFAPAWAGLAQAYGAVVGAELMPGSEKEIYDKSLAAANKAISLDPSCVEAYASRAAGTAGYYWDFVDAERDYRRAIKLKPNYATVHQWYASDLIRFGRAAEARREIDIAYELEPFSIAITSSVCWNRMYDRRYGEAIAFCRRVKDIDPELVNANCLSWCHLLKGEYEDAIAAIRPWNPQNADELAAALARGGSAAFWKKRSELYERTKMSSNLAAASYAMAGDRDSAFAVLDDAFKRRAVFIKHIGVDPRLDNLRSDPRFEDLLRRIAAGSHGGKGGE